MNSALIARLRDDLAAARYGVETLTALWGVEADAGLFRGQRVPALRGLENSVAPAARLARAFVLGLAVERGALEAALPSLGVDGAIELGLVELVEGSSDAAPVLRPLLDLRPYSFVDAHGASEFTIASDLGELALGHAIPPHHVLGVGGASMTLSGLMIDEPVDSVLDLGTGCGIQALHAARHARRVVATDISQRALDLAALNAQLNGIDSIEFRLGSLFEPVAGERFDQIVSNPPFVITPRVDGVPAYEYRDGGLVGDALVAQVVQDAAEHLAPGGVAQLLGNWEYRGGVDAFDRLDGWLDGTGLDAWIVEREVQSVEQYAETWIRDGGTRSGTAEFDRLYGAWLDDFAARGVTRVGFGYMTLRMPERGSPTLRRLERLDGPLGNDSHGSHIAATLRAHDWLTTVGEEGLADARLTLAGDVTEERHYWPGDEHPTVMTLRQGGGFARSLPLDTAVAALVGACDGELSIRAIAGAIAELLDVDGGALLEELLPSVRELVLAGVLLSPAE
ncbi:methyltransferase family protein [Homoserinimonas aerilata]|uniref:Methyltransferase family protein n=1 Tax=Homoserinimonas aerilata TaxID=1162970 RepID=A0A542YHW5_9MICO|nr:methyltransferase [Homoserinimonas aerilata]TQL47675.1 methyltransferase family protein [Homoserinimonas aerilata]